MSYQPPVSFDALYTDVPVIVSDVETTGTQHGIDRIVEVGMALFVRGQCVEQRGSLINPEMEIPAEATEIHSLTDAAVKDAPTIRDFFSDQGTRRFLTQANQHCAYNAGFDRGFLTPHMAVDHSWPWLDTLVLVRKVDRYAKGKGRHKLPAACERHGVTLEKAHSAESDAKAAGELFYKLMPLAHINHDRWSIGELLYWTRSEENEEWSRFHKWLAKQPPMQPEQS